MTDALVETLEDLIAARPTRVKDGYARWEASIGRFILDLSDEQQESAAKLLSHHLSAQILMPLKITNFAVSEILRKARTVVPVEQLGKGVRQR